MTETTLGRIDRQTGSGLVQTLTLVALVGLVAVPSLKFFGSTFVDLVLDRAARDNIEVAGVGATPELTQRASAMTAGTAARIAGRAAADLAQVTRKLDSLSDLVDVAHYAPVPRRLENPYFNGDVTRAMNLRPASGTNAPGYQLAQKVAKSLQDGIDPESIARAAGDDRTVRMVADILQDVRRNYGAGEFDAHEFVPGGFWDWDELDHVLHYVAEPLEPYANWAGPGPGDWLRGKSAGRFAIVDGQALTPLQRRLQTYRKLFDSKGVSDEVRHAVFQEVDDATRLEIKQLQSKRASLVAQVQAEELQNVTRAAGYMSPEIVETLKRLLSGNSDETRAQRELLFAALTGQEQILGLEPSQVAARVRNRVRALGR